MGDRKYRITGEGVISNQVDKRTKNKESAKKEVVMNDDEITDGQDEEEEGEGVSLKFESDRETGERICKILVESIDEIEVRLYGYLVLVLRILKAAGAIDDDRTQVLLELAAADTEFAATIGKLEVTPRAMMTAIEYVRQAVESANEDILEEILAPPPTVVPFKQKGGNRYAWRCFQPEKGFRHFESAKRVGRWLDEMCAAGYMDEEERDKEKEQAMALEADIRQPLRDDRQKAELSLYLSLDAEEGAGSALVGFFDCQGDELVLASGDLMANALAQAFEEKEKPRMHFGQYGELQAQLAGYVAGKLIPGMSAPEIKPYDLVLGYKAEVLHEDGVPITEPKITEPDWLNRLINEFFPDGITPDQIPHECPPAVIVGMDEEEADWEEDGEKAPMVSMVGGRIARVFDDGMDDKDKSPQTLRDKDGINPSLIDDEEDDQEE